MNQWKQVSATTAAVLALASGGAHALGLGTPTSRAILGESLRLSVPLELESGEDGDDGCPQVEVLYGDSRVDAGKVILGISPQTGRHRVVTVRAIRPIDEPLIEVTLSYGCSARLSRKFTVFANPPEFVPTMVLSPASNADAPLDQKSVPPVADAVVVPPPTAQPRSREVERVDQRAAGGSVPRAIRPLPVKRPPPPPAEVKPSKPQAPQPIAVPAPPQEPAVAPKAVAASAAQTASSSSAQSASSVVLRKPLPTKPSSGARLELDPVSPALSAPPGVGASNASPAVQPSPASSQAATSLDQLQVQLAQDRQRIQELEKTITQLRLDAAQVRASGSGGGVSRPAGLMDANHPIWLLAISAVACISLLFSGYLFVLVRRRERERAWWSRAERR